MPASPLHISRCESLWHEDHCPECGAEAEAAQQAAPLDVEALARAIWMHSDRALAIGNRDKAGARKVADILAAAYARLAPAQARPADAALAHEHDFVDPTNEIVNSNGYLVCRICGRLQQPTPAEGA